MTATRTAPRLSKSKLMACRQCPRRLWLEWHRPDLRDDAAATQAAFDQGHAVGQVARQLYDRDGKGIEVPRERVQDALAQSKALLRDPSRPLFEAGFESAQAYAFADVLLPVRRAGQRRWRLIEVKAASEVKDVHREDVAIQCYTARQAGVDLAGAALAHVDTAWVYPGGGDYDGLLQETDLTREVRQQESAVENWIGQAQRVVAQPRMPEIDTGPQCHAPYECGFLGFCESLETQPEHPATLIPGKRRAVLVALMEQRRDLALQEVPDALLSDRQRRVKHCTLRNEVMHDLEGATADLQHALPHYYLDFETVQFAVPIWKGTRPYQQIPFQFVLLRHGRNGTIEHTDFLDVSGKDPSRALAESLIQACGRQGVIYAYNAGFERRVIQDLAQRFRALREDLLALADRLFDLLAVARARYYHPAQRGSWSIKALLPAISDGDPYADLDGIHEGGMAAEAYRRAIQSDTAETERQVIAAQLKRYCALDVQAMCTVRDTLTGTAKPVTQCPGGQRRRT